MEAEKIKLFLEELTRLCKKHNIFIGGCGECGSPWMTDDINDVHCAGDISWNEERKEYEEKRIF